MEILIIVILCFAYVNGKTFPECHGKPSGTYVADYRKRNDCRSFIHCDGRNSFEDECSLGLAFNPVKLICDQRENVLCDDDNEVDIRIRRDTNDSPIASVRSIVFGKRSDLALTKQYPTPPGRTSRTKTTSRNPNRPVPTRKPSQQPTRLTPLVLSTTRKNTPRTSVSPNRPSTNKPTSSKTPKTSTKPSSNGSPIYIPTPQGSQNVPGQSKEPVLSTLSDETETEIETESPRLPTENNSYISTTKSRPKTKVPMTPRQTTTETYQTELPTSSTVRSEIAPSLQEECTKKNGGNFADPDNCHYYYRCSKGVLNRQECPKGFGWDTRSKMCTTKGCLK